MTDAIVDAKQRLAAIQPEQSFIVQAPAGSGKTGLLIQRYLNLLAKVDAPEEIVAITFTRKAAAEMQGRILKALEMATGDEPESDYEKQTYRLAKAVLARDKKRDWHLLENPVRMRIQTIDSLCGSMVRQMPLLSQLGAQPETVEDPRELYQQAAINTLAELESGQGWSDSIAQLVFHLDNDLPRIKTLIMQMLAKRDQWLPYVIADHDRAEMERSLANLIEDQLQELNTIFPDQFKNELIQILQYAAKHIVELNPDNLLVSCLDIDAMPGTKSTDLIYWQAISNLLLTAKGTWRKKFDKRDGFPAASENKLEADERNQRKKQIQALITELQKHESLQQALVDVSQSPNASYTDDEWQIVNALCELLKLSATQLQLVFSERNQIDFIGMALSATQALGSDEEPTDLAVALDYQLKHILVDEYQDISVNQYRLLHALTREWSIDDGRSLFLVGDPMQSIYRFREAEVGLFIKTFHEEHLGQVPLVPLKLQVNFRSRQPIVEWFNNSFQEIFPAVDDVGNGAVSFTQAVAHDQTPGKDNVVIYPLYNRSYQQEARHTQEIINELRNKDETKTIAILVRSRTHLTEIIPLLREADLPFTAIDIEGLAYQASIHDLLALTRAYLYPADRIAWLSCLRAPWCGLTVQSLHAIANTSPTRLIHECINDKNILEQLDATERLRLEKVNRVLNPELENRQRKTLRTTIETLWIQLGGPATLNSQTDLENCETYFELLDGLDRGGVLDDMQTLVEQMNQLFAAPEHNDTNPIQIMTMHKAKGLEFDHVILPGLGRAPRSSQNELLSWLLRTGREGEELILAPIRATGIKQAPIYEYIKTIDKHKQAFEDARLLYVASTRAKQSLHLIGQASIKEVDDELKCTAPRRSLLGHLWSVVKEVYEKHLPEDPNYNVGDKELLIDQNTYRLHSDWSLPETTMAMNWSSEIDQETESGELDIEFEWAGETIKHIGSLVHNMIQHISDEGIEHWNANRIDAEQERFSVLLKQLGVTSTEIDWARELVVKAMKNILNDERGQWILAVDHQQARNEYSLSGLYNNKLTNVILDRTFLDSDNTRWIIDYKTSRHEGTDLDAFLDQQQERYQPQLEKYAAMMQQFSDEPIKLGLYFPLLKGWREWSFDSDKK